MEHTKKLAIIPNFIKSVPHAFAINLFNHSIIICVISTVSVLELQQ